MMKKKDRTFEIGVIVLMVSVSFVLLGIFLIIDIINSKKTYTIFMRPYQILECKKWDCEDKSDKSLEFNNKPYKIYTNGSYLGEYKLYYNQANSKYYVFDSDSNNLYNNGDLLFAYSGKASISQKKLFEFTPSSDEINMIRDKSTYKFPSNVFSKGVKMDFDNDGDEETLLYIHDENEIESNDKYFTVLAYVDGKKVSILHEESADSPYEIGYDYVSNVIDIFEDGKLEFVNLRSYADLIGNCNVIYRLKGKKFVSVNECEVISNR